MAQRVYLETTVISYLTARPSRDIVIAGHQQVTREWWETARLRFELLSSELVVQEASAGDPDAAKERLVLLATTTPLEMTEEALALGKHLLRSGAVPTSFPSDALHIAIAVVNGANYLLT